MIFWSLVAAVSFQDAAAEPEICIVGSLERLERMEVLQKDIGDIALEIEDLSHKLEAAQEAHKNSVRRAHSFRQDGYDQGLSGTASSEEQVFVGSHRGREEMTGLQPQVEHQRHLAKRINEQIELRNARIVEFRALEREPQQVTECNAEDS